MGQQFVMTSSEKSMKLSTVWVSKFCKAPISPYQFGIPTDPSRKYQDHLGTFWMCIDWWAPQQFWNVWNCRHASWQKFYVWKHLLYNHNLNRLGSVELGWNLYGQDACVFAMSKWLRTKWLGSYNDLLSSHSDAITIYKDFEKALNDFTKRN